MSAHQALRIALRGLLANRLRSALTMLGIMIGVAAVILLVSLGNGAKAAVTAQIESVGSNLIFVTPGSRSTQGVSQGFGSGQALTQKDLDALQDPLRAPNIEMVVPITNGSGMLLHKGLNWRSPINGSNADFFRILDLQLGAGRLLTEADVRTSAKVVVLGQIPLEELFGGDAQAAVGETVKIERQTYTVVGVLKPQGAGAFGNLNNTVVIPITTTWNYLLGGTRPGGVSKRLNAIAVRAVSAEAVPSAEAETTQILLHSRKVDDPDDADFAMYSQQQLLRQASATTATLTAFLAAIAAVSLAVGGIGVMNIMLVTVTERTREIGIRKAIGARRRAIQRQFLIEAMVLTGLGGAAGALVGIGLSTFAGAAIAAFGNMAPPKLSAASVVIALAVSVGIGLFFGVYPANRAARLRPIDALRYE